MNPQLPVTDPEAHEASIHPYEEGKKRAMLIGLILTSVLLAALAQLTLKHGMNQVTDASGTASLSPGTLKSVVTNVYVLPSHRGGGLGRRLLAAALAWCDAHDIDSVVLWPTPRSRRLYARHGFTKPRELLERR